MAHSLLVMFSFWAEMMLGMFPGISMPPAMRSPMRTAWIWVISMDGAEFSRGQGGIVQYGGDHVHPVEDLGRHRQKILVDHDLHAAAQEQQGRHEDINLGAPYGHILQSLGLLCSDQAGLFALLACEEHGQQAQGQDAGDDIDGKLVEEEEESGIIGHIPAAW